MHPAAAEAHLCRLEPPAFVTDAVCYRHAAVRESHIGVRAFADLVVPEADVPEDLHPRRALLDEDDRGAFVDRDRWVGYGHHQ